MLPRKQQISVERHNRVRELKAVSLRRFVTWLLMVAICESFLIGTTGNVRAALLYDNGDIQIRWDNTVRYSAAVRLTPPDKALISDPNADDGDRNFRPGIASNRLDLLSEFDVLDGSLGFHASAAGWYDTVYHQRNGNDSPSTFNPVSVPHNQFTRAVQTLHGADVELLDAFLHGNISAGQNLLSFRVGRDTTLWGESLFFAQNGIAAGQAPVDEIKELNSPTIYAKEVFLPVDQASVIFEMPNSLTLSAYYQFEWRKDRVPGSGSFFSAFDYLDAGGERYIVSPGKYLLRSRDQRPPELGQFGVRLQFAAGDFTVGLYALRFNSKVPQVYLRPANSTSGVDVGTYNLAYPEGISLYGASVSGYLLDLNFAGEVSLRTHMPLGSNPIEVPSGSAADNREHALYPIGDTLHAQVSSIETIAPNSIWESADVGVELAAVERLAVTQNAATLDPSRTPFAMSVRASFVPHYFEVLPGLDLTVPLGIGYGIAGNSSTEDNEYADAGDVEIGLGLTYRTVWNATLSLTKFVGSPDRQPLGDRTFMSLNLQRSF
jgi:hypothetical protein